MTVNFTGSMVALITPFDDGEVDESTLRQLVRRQEEGGTDVLVPCGTTGESATLSYEEHEQVIEVVVDEADEADVLAGTGSNSTHEAKRLTRHADEVGCDGALVITPYYNKPPQRGMESHFRAVADEVDLPLVLYNVPSRTGINLDPDTVARLATHPSIVGIKEASGGVDQGASIERMTPDDFNVVSGDDGLTLPLISLGAEGVVSVAANLVPSRISRMVRLARQGDFDQARELHQQLMPLFEALFFETNPIPAKEAAGMLGLCEPEVRSPLARLSEGPRDGLKSVLEDLGVLNHE